MRTISKHALMVCIASAVLAACGGQGLDGPQDESGNELTSSAAIYGDALSTTWQNWSWATVNFANGAPVASGTRSIAVTFGPWTGLYVHTSALSTTGLAYLDLKVNGGTTAGARINAKVAKGGTLGAGVALAQYCTGGTIPANAWTRCLVPLSAMGAANTTIDGVILQEGAGRTLPPFYVDEVAITASAPAPTPAPAVAVSISPTTSYVTTGATQAFAASVANTTNAAVTWRVQEGAAGGAVSSAGSYTAPSVAGTFHVVATSQADTTKSATAVVNVTAPSAAVAVSIAPASASVTAGGTRTFSATVTNTTNTAVTWSVQEGAAGGAISSAGIYTAPSVAGTYHVVATSQADATKTATAVVNVTAPSPAVAITISPASASITTGGTQTFSATVTNTTNPTVIWTVQEGAAGGAISSTGQYTAPSAAGTYHVVATSQADSTKTAVAVVYVSAPTGGGTGGTYTLPADRGTKWQPGVTYNGGIPSASWPVHATLSPTGNDVGPIQAALDAAHAANPNGAVVALAAGTYNFNSGIVYVPSRTVLRGAGPGKTILKVTNGATPNSYVPGAHNAPLIIVGPSRWGDMGSSTNLTADAAKGATSVTVASTAGLSVGQIVLIDELSGAQWMADPQGRGQVWASPDWRVVYQLHNPGQPTDDPLTPTTPTGGGAASWFSRQDRPTTEIKQIASISGTTVTFTTPFHISYRIARKAQLTTYPYAFTTNAGVESLTLSGGDDGNIRFLWASRSWAKNIESTNWLNEGIAINNSFGIELRDSYLHDAAWPSPGGGGYAISFSNGSSEALIENNISVRANKVMVARCSGAGSVVGYNYLDEGYIDYSPTWIEVHLNGSHMVGPHHMLFEGNYAPNYDSDKTHGNSVYHTVFRNHLRGLRAGPFTSVSGTVINDAVNGGGPMRCAGVAAYSYWHSFVGNVLGASGKMGGWVLTSGNMDSKAIWLLGWDDWSPNPVDPNVAARTLRDGNFDYLTNAIHWDGIGGAGSTSATLPNSLYMPGKPVFFGANTWPWVNPNAGVTYTLPAKARFDAGTPNIVP